MICGGPQGATLHCTQNNVRPNKKNVVEYIGYNQPTNNARPTGHFPQCRVGPCALP
ncbi:hypothetical protein Premu_2318 [Hallella multisaccharivorax DSM 17128]|uniref:Uncharacterized protein n=1 Tax=Hallella multisaccharivorax DSM 17128 TaxID=688246 RepID=F8N993_9BACT|nr:hypothetical protein Premu_2318 [Hallella multisaccharivorax DSM 17128]